MEEEDSTKTEINNTINALNMLCRRDVVTNNPSTSSISRSTAPTSSYFNMNTISSIPYSYSSSLQMKLNHRYISKITSSPRKVHDTSLRMRPYYVPERSRTKSENAVDTTSSSLSSSVASVLYNMCGGNNVIGDDDTAVGGSRIVGGSDDETTYLPTNFSLMDTSCCSIGGDSNSNGGLAIEMNGTTTLLGGIGGGGVGGVGNFVHHKKSYFMIHKSKSLEDINSRLGGREIDGSQPSHEMEFVSSRIQKLKVQD